MQDTETILRRAVCESPFDDLPRLAYADYLEEVGEKRNRTTYIRKQIAYPDRSLFYSLYKRNSQYQWLLRNGKYSGKSGGYLANWLIFPAAKINQFDVFGAVVKRGFVSSITLPCSAFLSMAKDLFSRHPIEQVFLTNPYRRMCPYGGHRPGSDRTWFFSRSTEIGFPPIPANPDYAWLPIDAVLYRDIFDLIKGGELVDNRLYFSSASDAISCVSNSLVNFGRSLVDLPELPASSSLSVPSFSYLP